MYCVCIYVYKHMYTHIHTFTSVFLFISISIYFKPWVHTGKSNSNITLKDHSSFLPFPTCNSHSEISSIFAYWLSFPIICKVTNFLYPWWPLPRQTLSSPTHTPATCTQLTLPFLPLSRGHLPCSAPPNRFWTELFGGEGVRRAARQAKRQSGRQAGPYI